MTRTTTAPRTALTQEGRGEISTLDTLLKRYRCSYITVEQLLNNHFTQYSSAKTLLQAIKKGRLNIRVTQLGATRKAPRIVYLTHLAEFIDQTEQPEQTAADQAA